MLLLNHTIKEDKKNIIASFAVLLLLIFTLHGYISTMHSFFDIENSDKLADSLLRAGAYSNGGGGATPPSPVVIDFLDPDDAFDLLESFSARQIARVLEDVDLDHAGEILAFFESSKMIEIFLELPSTISVEILLSMDQESSSEVISELDNTNVEIIQVMVDTDVSKSAVIIEEAVKILISNLEYRTGILS